MTYLVGTHSFLFAVDLDESWQVTEHRVLNTGHHYGIAPFESGERRFLAKRPATGGREVMVFGAEPPFPQLEPMELERIKGSHQMAVANGGLYIANTGFNSVVFESFANGLRHEYFFNGEETDHNHVNSVFPCGDQIFVVLHNLRRLRTSQMAVLRHDLARGFTLHAMAPLWHTGCHNVFVDDSHLYYNASQTGEFVAVDLDQQRIVKTIPFHGHTKGLSVVDDRIVIGVSEHAERGHRNTSKSYLAVIDRGTLETVARVDLGFDDLPHPPGNVNEVRSLSPAEEGHRRPEPFTRDWAGMQLARRNRIRYAAATGRVWQYGLVRGKARIKRRLSRDPAMQDAAIAD